MIKGLRSTNWWLQNSHGDVKYSIGNIVDNNLITMYGPDWCGSVGCALSHKAKGHQFHF